MSGFIKLFRDIQFTTMWKEKPFSKVMAWIDLIFMAKFQDTNEMIGYQNYLVKRGFLLTTQEELEQRWGWSTTKLRHFLSYLQGEQMIKINSMPKKTEIEIVNYSVYQNNKTAEKPLENRRKTDDRVYIDKEVKEVKEGYIKEEINKEEKIRFGKVVLLKPTEYQNLKLQIANLDELIEKMNDYCLAHGKKYKDYAAALRTWAKKEHNQPTKDHPASWDVMKEWAEERKNNEI